MPSPVARLKGRQSGLKREWRRGRRGRGGDQAGCPHRVGGGVGWAKSCRLKTLPAHALPTCCCAWILMYSALCLPCLPLSGLPAWPWVAFSREAPGVTTFMGGTPLCRKKNRVGTGSRITQDP